MPNDGLFFWMFVCHLSHEPCLSQNISIFWRLHSKISTYSQDVSSIAWIALFSLRGSTTIVGLRHSDPKSWNRWTLRGRRRENRARGPNMEERLLTRLDGTGALWYVYFGPKNPSGRFFFWYEAWDLCFIQGWDLFSPFICVLINVVLVPALLQVVVPFCCDQDVLIDSRLPWVWLQDSSVSPFNSYQLHSVALWTCYPLNDQQLCNNNSLLAVPM